MARTGAKPVNLYIHDGTNWVKWDGTITTGDIAIGAVELKDADSVTRVDIETDGTKNAMYVQANSLDIRALASGTDSIDAAQSGSWTVTANAGTNLNTSALLTENTFTGRVGEVQASPTANTMLARLKDINDTLSGGVAVTGTFWQTTQPVSMATLPDTGTGDLAAINSAVSGTLTVQEASALDVSAATVTVQATNLDIRDLVQTSDAVAIYGSDDGGTTMRLIETDSGGAIAIQDGGNTITVDGTVAVSGTVTVDLGANNDVTVTSGSITEDNSGDILTAVQLIDNANTTISSTDVVRVAIFNDSDSQITNFGGTIEASATVTGVDTLFDADGDNTAQECKASAGNLYGLVIHNSNTSEAWIQFFDAATGSVTVGTTTPKQTYVIPSGDGTQSGLTELKFNPPISFSTAITYACTTTATGSSDPSTGLIVNLLYK